MQLITALTLAKPGSKLPRICSVEKLSRFMASGVQYPILGILDDDRETVINTQDVLLGRTVFIRLDYSRSPKLNNRFRRSLLGSCLSTLNNIQPSKALFPPPYSLLTLPPTNYVAERADLSECYLV